MGLISKSGLMFVDFRLLLTLTLWYLTALTLIVPAPVLTEDCPENYVDCGNGRCMHNIWRCDGDNDCGNLKDEENCHLPPEVKCLSSQFKCVEDHHCIPYRWYCDGEHDCKDGSDEKQCNGSSSNCGFRCRSEHCIPARWQCDGEKDCADGSDEENCKATAGKACPEHDFTCASGVCLKKSLVCDGKRDCPEGEDEGTHCGDACDNSTCQHKCRATPSGAECFCNPGYELQKDRRTCSDINECLKEGFCSHRCTNTIGNYSCSCLDGYFLKNRTCIAKGPEPLLVFVTPLEVRGLLLRTQKYFLIRRAGSTASAVDVDPKDSRVYWTEISRQGSSVYSSQFDGSQFKSVITNGLLVPEDLSVDWIGRNLYITDSGLKQVLVCKIDGSFCSVLHENVDRPRSIVLDPPEGLMYWTDWGKNPGIFRSGMDGTRRLNLVSNGIQWPNGIAIDHTTNRLYWCDAKTYKIECITLDGKTRKVILQEERMFHPYSLAVFEDTIYWSDWSTFSVGSCNKFTGHNQTIIARENGKHVFGVHVYHPVLEKSAQNPCWSTLCSHMCVLSPFGQHRCLCPPGFYLASDKTTCKIDAKSRQILVSDGGSLLHVQPQGTGNRLVTPILANTAEAIGDIAYDREKNVIFISDIVQNVIRTVKVTTLEKRDLIKNHLHSAEGLEYDWMGNNLYWTDLGKGTVEVFALNTGERIVLVIGLLKPLALALLPEKGLMFVSVIGDKNPHISMFDMDGKNGKILQSAIGLALSLAVDPKETRIYYVDPRSKVIASVDYLNPKTPRVLHKSNVDRAVSVAVSEQFIYWTTTKSDLLYRMHRNVSLQIIRTTSLNSNNLTTIRKVKFFSALKTGLKNMCSSQNGGCSHICLLNPAGRTCACPVSFQLGPDVKTCEAVSTCSQTEVRCAKGSACIPQSWVCDGSPDCYDGSDEENCGVKKQCPDDEFQCKNGRCLNSMWRCDSSDDCGDGSDEEQCNTPPPCRNSEFDCGNGLCAPQLWRCDGEKDCVNGKDEEDCHLTVCKPDQLRCDHGKCIPTSWGCDGSKDCLDGTDENNCPVTRAPCKISEFQCQNGNCVDNSLLCDHRNDCHDNSDEQHCVYSNTCKAEMFRCEDGLCIYDKEICDGTRDCDNGEDEKNCTQAICENAFYCSKSKKCIPLKWVCDGQDDCGDATDEHLSICDHPQFSTAPAEVACEGFTCNSGECLPWDDVCNGIPDCLDYTDEGNLCATSCGKNNGGCSHLCASTPSGPRCACLRGFKLQPNGKTCEDEDECLEPTTCTQYCNNTKGNFKCSCAEGYFLSRDHRKCKAVGGAATLIYLLPDQIRGIELQSNSHKVYVSAHWTDIRGMDYDALTGTIFWTEWREGTISSFVPGSLQNDIIVHERQRPYFLKWDWIGQNIYYTTGQAHIRACNRNGTYCTTVMETKMPHINSLALAPLSGFMFWSVWSVVMETGSGIIERSNMDGSGRIEIITTKVFWPTSLAVDHIMNVLYWADVKLNVIESTDFNGLNRRTIVEGNLQYPASIALFEDLIYIADWGTDAIIHCSRLSPGNCTELHKGDVKSEAIMVVHRVQQPKGANPCSNRCQQLCFLKPSGYSCTCDEKFQSKNSLCVQLPPKPRSTTKAATTKPTKSSKLIKTTSEETKVPEECIDGFCLNGGTCKIIDGKRHCWCPEPYKGETCAETFEGMTAATADHSWIVAVLFGFLLAAALLLAILLCRRNKDKLRKLSENVSVSFRNPMFSARKSGRLVMDTDDPVGDDELMLGKKGAYKASEFRNPLFGQTETSYPDPQQPTGEFQRWSSYDSEDSAFISEYQEKGSTLNVDQVALVDPPKKDKVLDFFRKS